MIIFTTQAQDQIIPLWEKNIPGAKTNSSYKEKPEIKDGRLHSTSKVSTPTLTIFLSEKASKGTAVLICPGGGYSHLAMDKEGYKVAEWFQSMGIHAFVLKYRLPSDDIMQDKNIGPLQDGQEAIRLLRRNAEQWNIDPDMIGIMGFSAGGHLASTLSTHYNQKTYTAKDTVSAKPDFSLLIYPVISMKNGITHQGSKKHLLGETAKQKLIDFYSNEQQVNEQTPPAFLVHATDDKAVPVENSIQYYLALKENQVQAEMHLYQDGGHGFGLGRTGTHTQWPQACKNWLQINGYIIKDE